MGKAENKQPETLKALNIFNLSLLFLLIALPMSGRRLDVGQGKAYKTIGSALAAARDGDALYIHAGQVYREHLVVGRGVRLQGVGMPVIDGGRRGNVIEVRANGVTIDGLQLRNSGRSSRVDYCGIKSLESTALTVSHCVFRANQFSIMIQNGTDCVVAHNDI